MTSLITAKHGSPQHWLERDREHLRVFEHVSIQDTHLSCRDLAHRATLRHRSRRSWCQFCSCTSDSKRIPNKVHAQNTAGKQLRSTVAFAALVYHGPCQIAKHAPEFQRGAFFFRDIRSSRFLIGMPIPHATHVCRARTLERLTWGRRSAPRKALRRGLNRRPASSKPLRNSNASLLLSGRSRTREVHKRLRRNDLFASCR